MKKKFNMTKQILVVWAVLTVFAGLSMVVIYQIYQSGLNKGEESSAHPTRTAGIPDRPVKAPVLRQQTERESSNETPLQQKGQTQIVENRTRNEPTLPAPNSSGAEIVEGVGLTVNQLRALHAKQRREFESSVASSSFQAAAPDDETLSGWSVQDLLTLHEEQRRDFEANRRVDEIVIPPSEAGTPGITAAELAKLHEQQNAMFDNPQNPFEEVPAPAPVEDNSMGSVEELMEVHDRQWEQEFADSDEVASPPPEDGGPGLTVQELSKLHESQGMKGE